MSHSHTAHSAIEQHREQRRQALHSAFAAKEKLSREASRRRTPRVQVEIPLTLHMDEWETDTQTFDLSEGGYSFLSSTPPTQEFLPFALEIAPRRVVRGHARVVAHIPTGSRYRVCVSFAKLDAAAKAAITDRVLDTIEETMNAA
jgi:hypothetical protein